MFLPHHAFTPSIVIEVHTKLFVFIMAAPAPNFNNLAQSYVDIVRGLQAQEAELMKLQNLPALNVQQTLYQIQQTLAAILANQANFATQLAEIATRARHSYV